MDLKNFCFSCPFCNQELNGGDEIELVTQRHNGDRGRMFLSTTFGNYTYRHLPETEFEPGEVVDFYCPSCSQNLEAPQHDNFALVHMDVGSGIKFEIIFSREAGKRKTYVITDDGIETYHG